MKPLIAAALVVGLAGCAALPITADRVRAASPAQAALLAAKDLAFVIDVRTEAEFAEGRIPGAARYSAKDLLKMEPGLPADLARPIVVYDEDGSGSLLACIRLKELGYFNVYELGGGLRAWIAAGLPVERPRLPPAV